MNCMKMFQVNIRWPVVEGSLVGYIILQVFNRPMSSFNVDLKRKFVVSNRIIYWHCKLWENIHSACTKEPFSGIFPKELLHAFNNSSVSEKQGEALHKYCKPIHCNELPPWSVKPPIKTLHGMQIGMSFHLLVHHRWTADINNTTGTFR